MKKQLATKISGKPFELMGFTLDDYLKWCEKHDLTFYEIKNRKKFINLIDEYKIVKRNDKVYEDGEEL